MVDILKKVQEFLDKGASIWVDYPDVPGFRIQVAFVGRDEQLKIFDKFTRKEWSKKTRRFEDVVARESLMKAWGERVIKTWEGLTLKKVIQIIPIELMPEDDPESVVECNERNKSALLRHSNEFDAFILNCATDLELFQEHLKSSEAEIQNLSH